MTLIDSVRSCFLKYVDFDGRAGRSEFWWFALFIFVVGTVVSAGGSIADTLWTFAIVLPALAVGARRLHDTGRSAWWLLLSLLPVAGWIVLIVFFVQPSLPAAVQPGVVAAPP